MQQIGVFDRQGKVLTTLGEPGPYNQPALSPDGNRVAAIRTDAASRNTAVWVYDIATGKGTPITSDPAQKFAPVWSPDGKQIAYTSIDANQSSIYRKASDGSGDAELLYKHPAVGTITVTDRSANGLLSFWAGKINYALNVNGDRKAVELFSETYNVRGGRFSPDSHYFAYNSDETGGFQIYVKPFDASRVTVGSAKTNVSNAPAAGGIFWRQDGKELYYLSLPPEQALMAVDVTTTPAFQTGTPHALFKLVSQIGGPAQLSSISTRDGQRFVFLMASPAR